MFIWSISLRISRRFQSSLLAKRERARVQFLMVSHLICTPSAGNWSICPASPTLEPSMAWRRVLSLFPCFSRCSIRSLRSITYVLLSMGSMGAFSSRRLFPFILSSSLCCSCSIRRTMLIRISIRRIRMAHTFVVSRTMTLKDWSPWLDCLPSLFLAIWLTLFVSLLTSPSATCSFICSICSSRSLLFFLRTFMSLSFPNILMFTLMYLLTEPFTRMTLPSVWSPLWRIMDRHVQRICCWHYLLHQERQQGCLLTFHCYIEQELLWESLYDFFVDFALLQSSKFGEVHLHEFFGDFHS